MKLLVPMMLAALIGGADAPARADLGDGGPALEAELGSPAGLAVDHDNEVLFIADASHGRVRRVDLTTGTITSIAGHGTDGSEPDSGDGGPALEAHLTYPHALALSPDGALFVATYQRVRRIDPDGTISTAVGGAPCCAQDDGLPGSQTHIVVVRDIAVDPEGRLVYSDFGHDIWGTRGMIRRVEADGTVRTLEQGLGDPLGLAFDADGNLFFTEYLGYAVWKRTPPGVRHRVLAQICACYEDGPAPLAGVRKPRAIEVGPSGEVYIVDESLVEPRLRRVIHPYGQPATSVAGNVETLLSRATLGAIAAWDPPGGIGRPVTYALNLFVAEGRRVYLLDHGGLRALAGR